MAFNGACVNLQDLDTIFTVQKPVQKPMKTCICAAIRRANRAVTQLYDLALAPTGMKATQFMILQIIADAGEIAQCDFARQHSISVETLSRRFSSLRRKGLVATRVGLHSERIYSLTEQGRAVLLDARPYWENAETRLRQQLGEADWHTFLDQCEKGVQAAHQAEQLRMPNGHVSHIDNSPPQSQQCNYKAA